MCIYFKSIFDRYVFEQYILWYIYIYIDIDIYLYILIYIYIYWYIYIFILYYRQCVWYNIILYYMIYNIILYRIILYDIYYIEFNTGTATSWRLQRGAPEAERQRLNARGRSWLVAEFNSIGEFNWTVDLDWVVEFNCFWIVELNWTAAVPSGQNN